MRTSSRAVLALLLVAVIGLAAGCARRITGKVDVPYGDPWSVQVQSESPAYKDTTPPFVLDGKSHYFKDIHATLTVTDVINTRIIRADTTTMVTLFGQNSPRRLSVVIYLCQPLPQKADKYSDGTVVYGGPGYPEIVKGHTYTIAGILQPHWESVPLIYVPTWYDFKETTGNESFFYGPSDQFKLEPSFVAAEQVVQEFFTYWNEKNIPEMEQRMTTELKGGIWSFDKLAYVKLINMEPMYTTNANMRVFTVLFDVGGYAGDSGGDLTSGNHARHYSLKRDTATSPWLIYDWGNP